MTELLSTENVLLPRQVSALRDEKAQLEGMLNSPPHVRALLQDPKGVVRRIQNADKVLEQAPQPIPPDQKDAAVRAERELRDKWSAGMPTQAEMRKNPSGAIGKNIEWKNRTKLDVGTWKNLRRRMQESGMMNDHDVDGSNIERFRPVGGAQELNMDNTQIPGVNYHLPPEGAAPAVIFSAADQAKLKKLDPELSAALALLPNDARQTILDEMNAPQKKTRGKRPPDTEFAQLRRQAKGLGINTFQLSKDAIRKAVGAANRAASETAEAA